MSCQVANGFTENFITKSFVYKLKTLVYSPHHLFPQRVEKVLVFDFYHVYFISGSFQSNFRVIGEAFAAAVYGYQKIVAAAFYF